MLRFVPRLAISFRWMLTMAGILAGIGLNLAWGQEELPPIRVTPGEPMPLPEQELEIGSLDDVETLTRGPLHEAFAEAYSVDPMPGLVVTQEPPSPVEELLPEYRPEGEEMIWIPGYWGWDPDREDYIWISGVFRVPPEGQRWVPGYWQKVSGGWQWVSGFWMAQEVETIQYLEPPPASLEIGPSSPSPGTNYTYIPGYWNHGPSGYRWQTGYWYPATSEFVWVPPRYVWTPTGCVFVNGYWDWRLSLRGFCYAPAYISRVTYTRPNWCYRPAVMLNTNVVFQNLFVSPVYHHYMFGDYYSTHYVSHNIRPIYVHHQRIGGCDPLMSFYSAYYAKQGRDLGRWYSDYHHELRNDPTKRPPQKWSQVAKQTPFATQRDNDWIADTVQNIVSANPYKSKFVANPPATRETVRNLQQSLAELTAERRRIESLTTQPATKPNLGSGVPSRPSKDLVDKDLIQRDLKLKLPSPIDMKGNLGGKLDRDLSLKKDNKVPSGPPLPQRLPSSLSSKGDAVPGITLGKPSDGSGASLPTLPSRVQDAIKSTPPNLSSMPSSPLPRNLPAGQGNGLGQGSVLSGNSKPSNPNPNLPTTPPLGRFEPPKFGQGDTTKKDPFRNEGLNNALEQSRRLREEALKGRSLTNPPNLNRSIPGNATAPMQLNPPMNPSKGSRIETNKPLQGTPFRQEVQKPRIELPQSLPNLKSSGATNPPSGIGSQGPNFNFGNGNRSTPAKSNAPTPSLSPASTPRLGNGGITGPNIGGGIGSRLDSMPRLNPGRDRGSK